MARQIRPHHQLPPHPPFHPLGPPLGPAAGGCQQLRHTDAAGSHGSAACCLLCASQGGCTLAGWLPPRPPVRQHTHQGSKQPRAARRPTPWHRARYLRERPSPGRDAALAATGFHCHSAPAVPAGLLWPAAGQQLCYVLLLPGTARHTPAGAQPGHPNLILTLTQPYSPHAPSAGPGGANHLPSPHSRSPRNAGAPARGQRPFSPRTARCPASGCPRSLASGRPQSQAACLATPRAHTPPSWRWRFLHAQSAAQRTGEASGSADAVARRSHPALGSRARAPGARRLAAAALARGTADGSRVWRRLLMRHSPSCRPALRVRALPLRPP
jgi:hypothetical protein